MNCPKCGRPMLVMDHVDTPEHECYRERYCRSCNKTIYTVEFEVERNSQFATEWNKYKKKKAKITPVKDYGIR